jgi:hypothetical protein
VPVRIQQRRRRRKLSVVGRTLPFREGVKRVLEWTKPEIRVSDFTAAMLIEDGPTCICSCGANAGAGAGSGN